jgi:hypothetical protein
MSIGLFWATRTNETFGLQWKSYSGDRLIIHSTAYEGRLYEGRVKTEASRDSFRFRMTFGRSWRAGASCARIHRPKRLCSPHMAGYREPGHEADRAYLDRQRTSSNGGFARSPIRLAFPRKLLTFQVMRRTLGTDMQQHGTMKDAQRILRHASHQDNRERVYAGNTDERHGGDQFTDTGDSGEAAGDRCKIARCNVSQRLPIGGVDCCKCLKRMAPQVGLEPTTLRLTARMLKPGVIVLSMTLNGARKQFWSAFGDKRFQKRFQVWSRRAVDLRESVHRSRIELPLSDTDRRVSRCNLPGSERLSAKRLENTQVIELTQIAQCPKKAKRLKCLKWHWNNLIRRILQTLRTGAQSWLKGAGI